MSPIRDKLQTLSAVAAKLNQASDQLNETIERVEDEIQRSGVGLTVWLDDWIAESEWRVVDHEADDVSDRAMTEIADYWLLGYAKFPSGWHISVKRMEVLRGHEEYSREVTGPTPLAKGPRHVRMAAAPLLEELIDGLAERARAYVADIERAHEALRGSAPVGFVHIATIAEPQPRKPNVVRVKLIEPQK